MVKPPMLRSSTCAREDEEDVAGFDAWRQLKQVHNFTAQVCERKRKERKRRGPNHYRQEEENRIVTEILSSELEPPREEERSKGGS